jgi:hypothetical protein
MMLRVACIERTKRKKKVKAIAAYVCVKPERVETRMKNLSKLKGVMLYLTRYTCHATLKGASKYTV